MATKRQLQAIASARLRLRHELEQHVLVEITAAARELDGLRSQLAAAEAAQHTRLAAAVGIFGSEEHAAVLCDLDPAHVRTAKRASTSGDVDALIATWRKAVGTETQAGSATPNVTAPSGTS